MYIIGERFVRYDIKEGKFLNNVWSLPSGIGWISSATSNSSETYALILTDIDAFIFTEENGFVSNKTHLIPNFESHPPLLYRNSYSTTMFCID